MKLLDAINLVMPKLGERPVTSLDVKHPTLAIVLPIVANTLKQSLQRGWWFNEYPYTAYPASDGTITLGADTLSFVPYTSGVAVARGLRLFNPTTRSYTFTEKVEGNLIEVVPFDELPETAASFVFYSSLVEAYATDLGVTSELQVWQQLSGQAWSDLLTEHLRQRQHSTRRTRAWRNYQRALIG